MINGKVLRDAFISGANNITNNREKIDQLNVFPVPDGDTGTNMSMTISSSVRELSRLVDPSATVVADTAASSFLRGARGNSGVILSLLFRGISKGLKGKEEVSGEDFADALAKGVSAAYKAVMKPTEGTILTVARIASERAAMAKSDDFLITFEAALDGAKEALAETPEMLPVLKKAGVVDAGGQGLVTIFEGMLSVFRDGKMIEANTAPTVAAPEKTRSAAAISDEEITFTYCTEFIINRDKTIKANPLELRKYLESIGDSCVVVDDEDIIKVHVHTNHPGNALEFALTYGPLVNLKIENMRDQNERMKHDTKENGADAIATPDGGGYTPVKPEKKFGFVSVCVGDGLEQLFTDLGVDTLVSGGQTMNPSTEDILKAVELTPAEVVFVLPNNKNIIMAAELAVPLATRKVIVLHTKTIPMGISAMLAFDSSVSDDDNAVEMMAAADNVSTGQITYAARNSDFDGHDIKEGDILALNNGKLDFTDTDFMAATVKLTEKMCSKESSFVTLIYGADVTDEQAEQVVNDLEGKLDSEIEISAVRGGQPIYYFIISIE
ncbi:MAG: DAK2 domain-containing protein [Clostridia bacterium]|nr:DAK2 domain-containing protein [Clostridia bacterium]